MDAVEVAKSGHPGMPMGMADIAEVLWNDYLRHNPANPRWADRDRFVLSNGHGSMLIYALLHLTGYDLPIDELKRFRQLHSKTAGHPEYGITVGVETTTGPLGQGLANAVGMALAERLLAQEFNRAGHALVDHYTYVFAGDGCLMEGISHEACSLAGHLGLGKLIVFYDDNDISIDGDVRGWFTEDTPRRFEAYGWHVVPNIDGHDAAAIKHAIEQARSNPNQPTLICCKTVIAHGAPNKAGTAGAHGAPLGAEEIQATRDRIQWPHPPFEIPNEIYAEWDARERGDALENGWNQGLSAYREAHPDLAAEFERRVVAQRLPEDWSSTASAMVRTLAAKGGDAATRKSSQAVLNAIAPKLPELLGGSADLTGSNNTKFSDAQVVTRESGGRYIHYGVREFGMTAAINGMALHGGYVPYGGTFLVFSDYARNAVRMAALMGQRSILVYTHDSIGLGEDGPTHQPIEHLASLRLIPNLHVWRPCDVTETAVAWVAAIDRTDGPSALALSRQNLPFQARDETTVEQIKRGGYILRDSAGAPEVVLIATGSEVGLAMAAAEQVDPSRQRVRVVSMPCVEAFDAQDPGYQEAVLPPSVQRRVAVEAGSSGTWHRFVGSAGRIIGIDRFGESAPGKAVYEALGLTTERVAMVVTELLQGR